MLLLPLLLFLPLSLFFPARTLTFQTEWLTTHVLQPNPTFPDAATKSSETIHYSEQQGSIILDSNQDSVSRVPNYLPIGCGDLQQKKKEKKKLVSIDWHLARWRKVW
jgi:hypothetical protein